jgi:hypothetical protein
MINILFVLMSLLFLQHSSQPNIEPLYGCWGYQIGRTYDDREYNRTYKCFPEFLIKKNCFESGYSSTFEFKRDSIFYRASMHQYLRRNVLNYGKWHYNKKDSIIDLYLKSKEDIMEYSMSWKVLLLNNDSLKVLEFYKKRK